jgi:hypothetical protein
LGTDEIHIVLDRPDSAKAATALEALLGEINAEAPSATVHTLLHPPGLAETGSY